MYRIQMLDLNLVHSNCLNMVMNAWLYYIAFTFFSLSLYLFYSPLSLPLEYYKLSLLFLFAFFYCPLTFTFSYVCCR
jgi:hypothetical protein